MTESNQNIHAFSFGDPESVLNNRLTDNLGLFMNPWHDYYETPVSQAGLVKLLSANAHHGTVPFLRKNMLCKYYDETKSKALSREDLGRAGFDYDVLGHCYFQVIRNRLGGILRYEHLPALPMRKAKEKDVFVKLRKQGEPIRFKPGEVIQLKRYDINQSIYGTVEYLGALNSIFLNESATLFRRKYFLNGAHMGYIFYTADADFSDEDEKAIKEQIKNSKGVGNFRSMFLNIPGGKPDSVKIIPVGDISQKDEFMRVKDITRNDILAAWRMPPALAGQMPENVGGFGDIEKIDRVYYEYETEPRQQVFLALNEYLPPRLQIGFQDPIFKQAEV